MSTTARKCVSAAGCIPRDQSVILALPNLAMSNVDLFVPDSDPLNDPLQSVTSLKEITQIYLQHIDAFHVDTSSGGEREHVEQGLKYIITLASPQQELQQQCLC